jgi:hypothetical protein
MNRNPRMFRCRLAKMVNGAMVTVTYIGPYDRIPPGWSMFMRRVIGPSGGMAA